MKVIDTLDEFEQILTSNPSFINILSNDFYLNNRAKYLKSILHLLIIWHELKNMRIMFTEIEPLFKHFLDTVDDPYQLKQLYHKFTIITPLNDLDQAEITFGGGQKIKYAIPLKILHEDKLDTLLLF